MREKIAEYLAQGYSQEDTAKIVGVKPSTISEYMKDEGFKELLKTTAAKPEYREYRINKKYGEVEEVTLNSLRKIGNSEFTEVADLCRILDSITRNKRVGPQYPAGYNNPTIGFTLVFPSSMMPDIVMDAQNRVVAIGDKSMKAMAMHDVKNMFAEMDANENAIEGESKEVKDEQRTTA